MSVYKVPYISFKFLNNDKKFRRLNYTLYFCALK